MPLSLDNSKLVAPRGRCVTAPCVLCSRTRGEGTSLKEAMQMRKESLWLVKLFQQVAI